MIVSNEPEPLVFIVDDEPANLGLYKDLLIEEIGCAVETCRTKRTALRRLVKEGFAPSVVLLDQQLPDRKDGLDVCRAIKGSIHRAEVQVVMITASDDPAALRECLEAGADDFLRRTGPNAEKVARIKSRLAAQRAYCELKKTQEALFASQLETARRDAIVRFARGYSHDVNNALMEMVEFIIRASGDPALAAYADWADEAWRHIRLLCRMLTEFINAEGASDPAPVSILTTLREVHEVTRARSLPSVQMLACNLNDSDYVLAHGPTLVCSLIELVLNAGFVVNAHCKADPSWPAGAIVLQSTVIGDNLVELAVADNGPGVHPEILPRIFEPKFSERTGGSGWGLYLAKQFVETMGGTLSYRDNDPQGAVFVVRLQRCGVDLPMA